MLKVEGPEDKVIYSGKEVDENYLGGQSDIGSKTSEKISSLTTAMSQAIKKNPEISKIGLELQMERGKRVYMETCSMCHQLEGQGIEGVFPPLAKSDFLMADKERPIRIVLKGLSGPITVNSKKYDGVMPPQTLLNDEQVSDVVTFVRNSWGNSGEAIRADAVKRIRDEKN